MKIVCPIPAANRETLARLKYRQSSRPQRSAQSWDCIGSAHVVPPNGRRHLMSLTFDGIRTDIIPGTVSAKGCGACFGQHQFMGLTYLRTSPRKEIRTELSGRPPR